MTTWAFASVAVRRTLRDRGNLFFLVAFPLLLVFFVGQQFGAETGASRIGVVVPADGGDLAADLLAALEAAESLEVTRVEDVAALEDDVAGGRLNVGVVLPGEGATTPVVRTVAGSAGNATAVEQVVTSALTAAAADARDAALLAEVTGASPSEVAAARAAAASFVPTVRAETVVLGGSIDEEFAGASSFTISASAQLLLFVFVTSLAGSGALIQARRWGVTRRALAAPITARAVLLGETAGRFLVAVVQAVIITAGAALLFGVDWGDPVATAAVTVLFCLVGAACAMLLGSVATNDAQASGVGVVLALGLAALGGCMLPLELFPDTLRQVAHVTPHAWGLDALAEITRRDGTVTDVLPELGVLAAYAAVLLTAGSLALRRAVRSTGG